MRSNRHCLSRFLLWSARRTSQWNIPALPETYLPQLLRTFAHDEIALATGGIAFVCLVLMLVVDPATLPVAVWYAPSPLFALAFYRIWRAEVQKVDELESQYPSLEIEFHGGDPASILDSYFGFCVRTSSQTMSARNVRVFLAEIVPLGEANRKMFQAACSQIRNVPIYAAPTLAVDNGSIDIHSGDAVFFPIIRRTPEKVMTFGHHSQGERCSVPTGPYRLRFRATGEDHRHAERSFIVNIRRPFLVDLNSGGEVIFELDEVAEMS